MRENLKNFRKSLGFTQNEFADIIGFSRNYYTMVELGKRNGSIPLWNNIQNKFHLSDDYIWHLTKRTK